MTKETPPKKAKTEVRPPERKRTKGHLHGTPKIRPVFRTLSARVRFTVLVAALGVGIVGGWAVFDMHASGLADAHAANDRMLAAATAPTEAILDDLRGGLTELAAAAPTTAAECERAATLAANALPYARVGVATSTGAVLCRIGGAGGAATVDDQTFFRRSEAGGFAIGDLIAPPDGTAEIGFAHRAGTIVAFAVIDASLLVPVASGPSGDAVTGILDARGAPAAASDDAVAVGQDDGLRTKMMARKRGSAVLEAGNLGERLYSYAEIGGAPSARLYAFAGVPTDIAFAQARLAALRIALVGGLMLLAAAWFAMVVGDIVISRRMRRLVHAMKDYVGGDEAAAEGITHGIAEFDGITDVYERLAVKLEESRKTLEERVRSRTSALEVTKGMTELEKAHMEALLASTANGVVATDADGKVDFINGVAREMMWWEAEEVTDVPVHQVFRLETDDEEIVAQDDWPHHKTLKTGQRVNTPAPAKPLHLRRKDKTRVPVGITISPIALQGQIIGALFIIRDITDEVEFDRRKSEFISIASHQLRSPISALKWLTDMLRKGDIGALSEKQTEWVDKIFVAAEKMNILVNELLNVSRMEAGVTQLNIMPTDAAKFMKEIMVETEALLAEMKQKFAFEEKTLPQVPMDALMMGEVLKNFISNASKYSPEGSAITVTAEARGDMFYVAIKDEGIGIPKADQKQMFNKFFRAQNAVESPIKGTGLGLYMAKSTVEMHGGEIGFDSEGDGKGCTFWFKLPLVASPPKVTDENAADAGTKGAEGSDNAGSAAAEEKKQ